MNHSSVSVRRPIARRVRAWARPVATAGIAAAALAIGAGPAQAGTYTIEQCRRISDGSQIGPHYPDGWVFGGGYGGEQYMRWIGNCGTPTGGLALDNDGGAGNMPGASSNSPSAYVQFQPADGTDIVDYELYRARRGPAQGSQPYFFYGREWCQTLWSNCDAGVVGMPLHIANRVTGNTPPLFGVGCEGTGCSRAQQTAWVELYAMRFTLSDVDRPQLNSLGGDFLATKAIYGTRQLELSAADVGGGLHKLIVTSNASQSYRFEQVLDSGNGRCSAPVWTYRVPCPLEVGEPLAIDTTRLPEGPQTLLIKVVDVAGNERSTSRSVVVDNVVQPTDPRGDFDGDGQPNETDNDDDNDGSADSIDPAPYDAGVPARGGSDDNWPTGGSATGQSGGPSSGPSTGENGTNASAAAVLSARFDRRYRSKKIRYGSTALVTGTLLDPRGRPITGARVDVHTRVRVADAPLAAEGTVLTDDAGNFSYRASVGPSRLVRFGYRANFEATDYSVVSDVDLNVIAGVRLKANRHRLRNGQTVTLSGSVLGAPSGSRKVVELQARVGRSWLTFATARLRKGRFSYRYRFTRTTRTQTYGFRARVRQESGWPFLTGASKTTRVRVRG